MGKLGNLVYDKIITLINIALYKKIRPDVTLTDVTVINKGIVRAFIDNYGIKGVILDVDDTLRKEFGKIPPCNERWLEDLKGEVQVVILSNGYSKKMQKYFEEREIEYIPFGGKPLKTNFSKICSKMKLNPEQVMVIGNDLFADILGGKRSKMRTALVTKVRGDHER